MRVAEIFGELSLKLSGSSKADLDGFEKSLLGIANAAKQAAAALAQLSGMRVPKNLRTTSAPQQNQPNPAQAPGGTTVPAATPGPAQNQPNPAPPVNPSSGTQQNQIARAVLFGLKVLGLGTLVVAIKRLISTMVGWVGASMKAAVGTELFTRQTGLSRKAMLEWELASQKAGLAEGEAAQAMETFMQKWQHMRLTGEGAAPFGMLGIDPSAGPEKIFRKFQERTRNMSAAEATYFGTLLGFSKDFAAFLHDQKGEIRRFNDEVLSDKEQKNVTELNAAWVEMSSNIGRLRDKIVSDLAPGLTEWIKLIGDTATSIVRSREKVYDFFDKLGDVLEGPTPSQIQHSWLPRSNTGASTTVNNDVSIQVDGSKDPRATGEAVRQALDKATGSAYYQRYQLLGGAPAHP